MKFLFLDRNWNMWIPGFGSEDLRPYKKAPATEAHKQVMRNYSDGERFVIRSY